ncbi:hypothetical protein Tco_0201694 [Tanacetum coccineum]
MLKWCEDTNLVLNWEKCHFMVKEGIVLGHKISKSGIEVDRAKVDVIAKLPHLTSVKGLCGGGWWLGNVRMLWGELAGTAGGRGCWAVGGAGVMLRCWLAGGGERWVVGWWADVRVGELCWLPGRGWLVGPGGWDAVVGWRLALVDGVGGMDVGWVEGGGWGRLGVGGLGGGLAWVLDWAAVAAEVAGSLDWEAVHAEGGELLLGWAGGVLGGGGGSCCLSQIWTGWAALGPGGARSCGMLCVCVSLLCLRLMIDAGGCWLLAGGGGWVVGGAELGCEWLLGAGTGEGGSGWRLDWALGLRADWCCWDGLLGGCGVGAVAGGLLGTGGVCGVLLWVGGDWLVDWVVLLGGTGVVLCGWRHSGDSWAVSVLWCLATGRAVSCRDELGAGAWLCGMLGGRSCGLGVFGWCWRSGLGAGVQWAGWDVAVPDGAGEVGWGAAAVSWRAEWWEGGGGGWVWGVAVDDWLMGWMAVSGVGELQWAACEDWAAETVEGRLWRGVACWGTWGVEQAELHCWLLADCWSLLVRGSGLLIGWRRETGRGMGLMCLLLAAGGGGWLLAGRSCDWLGWAGWWEGVPDWCVGLCGLWLELRVAGLSLHIAGSGCGRGCEGGVWEAAVLISCGGRGVWVGGLTVDLAAGRLGRAGRLLVWGGWTSGRAEESAETGLRLWTGSWPGMV